MNAIGNRHLFHTNHVLHLVTKIYCWSLKFEIIFILINYILKLYFSSFIFNLIFILIILFIFSSNLTVKCSL